MDVLRALQICRSVRDFSDRPIPEGTLRKVVEQLRLAPSASNYQPWRFVVVRDRALRRQLASAARSQMFLAQAPVLVVACGEPEKAQDFMGGLGNSLRIDVAVAFDRMMLAAAAHGLASCWIGAFDEREVRQILGVPDSVRVVAMTPLGYPADPDLWREPGDSDRRPFDDVIRFDRYSP